MQLQKTPVRLICTGLLVMSVLVGCSRHDVKKPQTITDSVEGQSTTDGKGGSKKASRGSQYDTLWDRLFALYALPPIDHPDIDRELSWFANHPAYLERAQNRAEPFLYSIVKLVEKRNVPGEIALLPIVESAFQPNVVSPAKAAGIWQFIPSTGTNYGLKRSHSYDGRRDVYASTKAAIKYLKKLHGDFGDWLLAIAAYNCGEGAVGRAIKRNQAAGLPTDFWSLNLPQETRAYVPKLLAVSRLFADAEKYGISLKDLPNMAKYKPVKVSNQLDLALAADAAGISLDKLYELNPGFRGQIADVDGSYHLYIPAEKKAADFRQEIERLSLQRGSLGRSTSYQEEIPIEPSGAFQGFRREFSQRRSVPNPGTDAGRFVPMSASPELGTEREQTQEIVPNTSATEASAYSHTYRGSSHRAQAPHRKPVMAVGEPPKVHPVVLAQSQQPHVARSDSGHKGPDGPQKKTPYAVQKGETLYAVARKNSVDVAQLAKWNKIPVNTQVQAGQKLVLAGDAQPAKKLNEAQPHSVQSKPIEHTAKSAKASTKTVLQVPAKVAQTESKRRNGNNSSSSDPRKIAAASSR